MMWGRQLEPRNRGMEELVQEDFLEEENEEGKERLSQTPKNVEGKLLGSLKGAGKTERMALFSGPPGS